MKHTICEVTVDEHDPIEGLSAYGTLVATAEVDGMVTRFVWHRADNGEGTGQIHLQTGNCLHFFDWTVWDYEKRKCTLSFTPIAFKAYVMERLTFPFELEIMRDMRTAQAGVGR